jgi:hypothetical protein
MRYSAARRIQSVALTVSRPTTGGADADGDMRDGAAQPASPHSKSTPTIDPRRCPVILPMRPAPPFRV